MNKRQAKKAFKKKYGCNPEEYKKRVCDMFSLVSDENFNKIIMDFNRGMEQVAKAVNKFVDDFTKFLQSEEFRKIMEAVSDALVQSEQIQEHENDC